VLTGMVYPKHCSEGCNAAQDKGLSLVYLFSVYVTLYQLLSLRGVMDKRPVSGNATQCNLMQSIRASARTNAI
jgi:hypothetical protein